MSNDQTSTNQGQESAPKSKIKTRDQIEQEQNPTPPRQPTPSSVLVYVGLVIVMYLYWGLFPGYPPLELEANLATSVFIRLLVIFLLVNRSIVGWIIGVVLEGIYIVVFSFQIAGIGGESAAKLWGLLFMSIALMALLLTRTTRQHVFRPDPEIKSQESPTLPPATDESNAQDQTREPSSSSGSSSA